MTESSVLKRLITMMCMVVLSYISLTTAQQTACKPAYVLSCQRHMEELDNPEFQNATEGLGNIFPFFSEQAIGEACVAFGKMKDCLAPLSGCTFVEQQGLNIAIETFEYLCNDIPAYTLHKTCLSSPALNQSVHLCQQDLESKLQNIYDPSQLCQIFRDYFECIYDKTRTLCGSAAASWFHGLTNRTAEFSLSTLNCDADSNTQCAYNLCSNGGSCFKDPYTSVESCMCLPGFQGTYCETYVSQPCINELCQNGGTCSGYGDYCTCLEPGWSGRYCEIPIDSPPCTYNSCDNGGSCLISAGGYEVCVCPPGFYGDYCQDIPGLVCISELCQNGGTCSGGINCWCPSGYSGMFCEDYNYYTAIPTVPPYYGGECAYNPCGHSGKCLIDHTGYQYCVCANGFYGQYCTQSRYGGPCLYSDQCGRGGTCYATNGYEQCYCAPGHYGLYCENHDKDVKGVNIGLLVGVAVLALVIIIIVTVVVIYRCRTRPQTSTRPATVGVTQASAGVQPGYVVYNNAQSQPMGPPVYGAQVPTGATAANVQTLPADPAVKHPSPPPSYVTDVGKGTDNKAYTTVDGHPYTRLN